MQAPRLKARFVLDADGSPEKIARAGKDHYRIRLQVENAPRDTYAVTYLLDPSYYQPVREARDSKDGFPLELTSFGDYSVKAKIRSKTGVEVIEAPLSSALAEGSELTSPPISDALEKLQRL